MKDQTRIWHNPRCSKSRLTLELLRENGIEPVIVEYLKTPPTADEIKKIIKLLDIKPLDLMRVKEPVFKELELDNDADRIQAMADGLVTLGVDCTVVPDGIDIVGGKLGGGIINSHHDHRIAMSFAISSLRASDTITILECENVATSFPNFVELANGVGLNIEKQQA